MNNLIQEYPVGSLLGEEEITAIRSVLKSGESLTRGKYVELFEQEFARYCGVKHAVAVSSCTAALRIAAQLLHLREGDEVICQANAFWATIVALIERRVNIVCADIDPATLNVSPVAIEPLITSKTKAIYVMHHGGNPSDMDAIMSVAKKYGIAVVEDAAHAVGAEYNGRKIGNISNITCFSFSTMKNITTLGEGGMITTNNDDFAEMARGLRTSFPYGRKEKRNISRLGNYPKPKSPIFMHAGDAWDYNWMEVEEIGTCFRMSAPQAAVGCVQLRRLDEFISKRADIAKYYNDAIDGIDGLRKIKVLPECKQAWHLFTFFIDSRIGIKRDDFVYHMRDVHNIEIVIRFWPIHLGGIMRMRDHNIGECPACEHVWFNEQLSLPISPQMREEEVRRITEALRKTMKELRNSK
jgi:perosamine synthetase